MNLSPAISHRPQARGVLVLLLAAAAIGAAFFLAEHDHSLSLKELVDPDSGNEERSVNEGNMQRRLGYGLLLAVGLCGLAGARQKAYRLRGFLPVALLSCLVWCLASITWSADVSLTIRRTGLLFCFAVGALGVGRCFTLRQLCILCVTISGAYLLIGLADELAQGVFQPALADYRFSGHVHPNLQASFCAAICLGSLCLLDRPGPLRYAWMAYAVLGLVFLLLTKSRTATVALVAGCAVIALFRVPRRRGLAYGLTAAWLLSAAVLAASMAGIDLERNVLATILIGRTDSAMSLTGRVPLWHHLLATVNDRILTGFGLGAFWTPQHIHLASAVVGSGITHAHSAYIETVLNLGIVGLIAYLLAAGAAVREVFSRCRMNSEGGTLFLAALMIFGLVHALTEALFVSSSFVPFFAACGLSRLAFHSGEDSAGQHGPATSWTAPPDFPGGLAAGSSNS